MTRHTIRVVGARQHNLRNLTVEIPRGKLVVITGVSGSGKSSLAFKTIYAEGQRRYMESLSAYARQFLAKIEKPDLDYIEGLSPAIAIEQRTAAANPRSTIATVTEIHDYLRLLFAAVGQPHDPETGEPIFKKSIQDIARELLSLPEGTRIIVLSPLELHEKQRLPDLAARLRREGFLRVRLDGVIHELDGDFSKKNFPSGASHAEAVVDRLVIRSETESRLVESIELALKWSKGKAGFLVSQEDGSWKERLETTAFANPKTGFQLEALTPRHFSFNSHLGACETCQGLGSQRILDFSLIISFPDRPLFEGGFRSWWVGQNHPQEMQRKRIHDLASAWKVDLDLPFNRLPKGFQEALIHGDTERGFEGLFHEAGTLLAESQSERLQEALSAFASDQVCPACQGRRLKPAMLAVTIKDRTERTFGIADIASLTIAEALRLTNDLALSEKQSRMIGEVLMNIRQRLRFLDHVGLGYLTLNRESRTLSGGESQRIRLATQIGAALSGVIYVLDEPSVGLHQRDNDRLLQSLREMAALGNTVIVVEHDAETIAAADHIIDMGPGAGAQGGQVISQGTLAQILADEKSLTGRYVSGAYSISPPAHRTPARGWLRVLGCRENNLKNLDLSLPIGSLTCVTGVSGSGKSTLVETILKRALFRHFYHSHEKPGQHDRIEGLEHFDKAIVIDQSPIGRSPRSNPATYVGAFNAIRELLASTPSARVRGFKSARFSFNRPGGRCEHCHGDGVLRIDMHFLNDVYVTCEACGGSRYNRETLEITYKGKNVADILGLTISQASPFFRAVSNIADKLTMLERVGLGYLKMGQAGTTLSGGEAQRVKLAAELAKKSTGRTLYLLDEPTTGLHFADVDTLLRVLYSLRDAGNTLVVIEHNLDVIKCADWIVDLGPEGGEAGGRIIAEGLPEQVALNEISHTARYLRKILSPPPAKAKKKPRSKKG